MQQTDLFLLFTAPLDTAGIVYMVGGSVASMVYGEPRLTNDIDIVVDLDRHSAAVLQRIFPATEFYCPPEEVIVVEAGRTSRGHCNIIHHETGHKADIYMRGRDAFQAWGLERRRWIAFSETTGLWVAPPEYVIVRKLEYFREGGSEKHVHDIRGMLAASGDVLDTQALDGWIQRLALDKVWEDVRQNA